MTQKSIVHYLNPWKARREREAARVAALRARDGDGCARCRRPLRFDLPPGHEQGAAIEPIVRGGDGGEAFDNLRLCHRRCSPRGVDHTGEVTARVRKKSEAALFDSKRKSRAA